MDAWYALFLGIVQGITEFLPISSSAHLILMPTFLGVVDQGVSFDLATHIGTLLAVLVYFRRDIALLITEWGKSITQRQYSSANSRLAWAILWGTFPAALAGLFLFDLIDDQLRSVMVILFTTVAYGVMLGLADIFGRKVRELESLGWRDVLIVGCAQALALIPGTSRSGVTITAALILGFNRQAASRLSFLLAIPITALAAAAKIAEVAMDSSVTVDWLALLIGSVTSFLTAILAIHYFLKFLNQFGMMPYVIYRLILAVILYFYVI
ncbi:undecaprenyl-diphosphate phosphatase [Vibrio vulnificus]|uniref:undecaprenyl-diphosphate phosphatase n=1 Tax=Vibrio fluvialis TaxID=676 RepID=UPI001A26D55D|nr:undecaprenyl-diphosphate phosphatase [Vibrio vulnificus]EKO3433643.1 undecaprenyl-diphosphate phosphatase [Vibrio fluvialis]EGR0798918.1 undecaprenyl-diphosphate phosphatase [Vibrio vulnificus]EGR0815943.1 undecaprenyl-diphosphate phosphatase [Vibrio vulnificus]EGR0877121.1 undecaprenyl-diphosphate phosphatase [Vibrio vulnificus]